MRIAGERHRDVARQIGALEFAGDLLLDLVEVTADDVGPNQHLILAVVAPDARRAEGLLDPHQRAERHDAGAGRHRDPADAIDAGAVAGLQPHDDIDIVAGLAEGGGAVAADQGAHGRGDVVVGNTQVADFGWVDMELQLGLAGLERCVDVGQAGDALGLRLKLLEHRDQIIQWPVALHADLERPAGDVGAALAAEADLSEGQLR